jgi:SAM-dependent methyltransferase
MHSAQRVLEVGCGTGAILQEIRSPAALHGLDLDPAALFKCRVHAPGVSLTCSDGHRLPYPNRSFDIVFCHFLLLWVRDPLQVVCEMARVGLSVLALAEPDYDHRVDEPAALEPLGRWQAESLRRQGADPSFGAGLAETFHRAGIELIEAGPIQSGDVTLSAGEMKNEWAVIEADLEGIVPGGEIQRLRALDDEARLRGERVLHVPTYFAWGKT